MKPIYVFPLVWVAVFCIWQPLAAYMLANDANKYQTLREGGEHIEAVVVDRIETRGTTSHSDDYDYALRLRIKVASGQTIDTKLKVTKERYDAHPVESTMSVVAKRDDPSQYMLQEDYDRHGPDGMREDAPVIRWLGGFFVATLITVFYAVFRRKPEKT